MADVRGQLMAELQGKFRDMKRDHRGEVRPTTVLHGHAKRTSTRRVVVAVAIIVVLALGGMLSFLMFWSEKHGKGLSLPSFFKPADGGNNNHHHQPGLDQRHGNVTLQHQVQTGIKSPKVLVLVSVCTTVAVLVAAYFVFLYREVIFGEDPIALVMGRQHSQQ